MSACMNHWWCTGMVQCLPSTFLSAERGNCPLSCVPSPAKHILVILVIITSITDSHLPAVQMRHMPPRPLVEQPYACGTRPVRGAPYSSVRGLDGSCVTDAR